MAAAQKWWRNPHVMWRHRPILQTSNFRRTIYRLSLIVLALMLLNFWSQQPTLLRSLLRSPQIFIRSNEEPLSSNSSESTTLHHLVTTTWYHLKRQLLRNKIFHFNILTYWVTMATREPAKNTAYFGFRLITQTRNRQPQFFIAGK